MVNGFRHCKISPFFTIDTPPQTSWVVLEIRTHPDRGGGLKIGDFGGRPLLTGGGWFWNFGRFRTGEGGL